MKQIIFVRHSHAEVDNDDDDFNRNLTVFGKKTALNVAKQISKKGITPEQIITSPAKRAAQTSEIYAKVLNFQLNKITINNILYSGFTSIDFLKMISKINNNYKCIMIFAHNPDISTITNNLLQNCNINFKPSTTIGIKFNVDNWNDVKIREGELFLFEQV